MSEEQAVIQFLLQSFGKNHLNLKNIVGIEAKAAKKYSSFFFFPLVFSSLLYLLINDSYSFHK